MSETWYPTCRYHPTEAPKGRKFTNEAEFNALSAEWVDTPTKFPALIVPDDAEQSEDKPWKSKRKQEKA